MGNLTDKLTRTEGRPTNIDHQSDLKTGSFSGRHDVQWTATGASCMCAGVKSWKLRRSIMKWDAVFGWCVMNIGITEQRQAKTALEAREHELSFIIETIQAFVLSASTLAVLLVLASPCFAQPVPTQAPPTESARKTRI